MRVTKITQARADPADRTRRPLRPPPVIGLVRAALREGRVGLAFQPVVAVATGRVDYYECLLRLRDAQDRTIAAGKIVPVLERLGHIGLIDRFVLDRIVEELAGSVAVRLGLNISGLTAADRPWLGALLSHLKRRTNLAARLVIEITETAALSDIEETARFVNALREAGCRVALDDFGAGHASLQHLQRLPVDTVKIDGSLVRTLTTSAETRVLLANLLGLAKPLRFQTVAECIETPEQAIMLTQAGVSFLQGFHYGPPTLERPWPGAIAAEGDAPVP